MEDSNLLSCAEESNLHIDVPNPGASIGDALTMNFDKACRAHENS